MDASSCSSTSSATRYASAGDARGTLTLKKAIDLESATAAQLINALPPAPPPAHLGSQLDIRV